MTRQLYKHSRTANHLTQVSVWEVFSPCWPPLLLIVCNTPVPSAGIALSMPWMSPSLSLAAPCGHTSQPLVLSTSAVFSLICLPESTVLPEGRLAVTLKPTAGHQQSVSQSGSWTSKTTLTRECFTILYEACFPETGRFICINLNV